MIKAAEIYRGMAIKYENEIYFVVDFEHVTKGNKRSYMQTKIKHITQGGVKEIRLRMEETLEDVFLDKKEMQYLYSTPNEICFMDLGTYDQISASQKSVGDIIKYMKPETVCEVQYYNGEIVDIILPNTVELKVVDTPPQIKGATATNQLKDAVLETGLKVRVPPFVEIGTIVKVDTRTGEYLERAH